MTRRLVQVGFASALLVPLAASGAHAGDAKRNRQVQRIAVAQFEAPNAAHARSAVLETLSDHDDVEVIALEDIAVAGKRLGVDPAVPASRRKLSEELGIGAWLDGKIEDGLARFTLQAPDGRVLASTSIQGHKASVAEGLSGGKVWEAMGPLLSPRERGKRALETQQELALKKVQARDQELVRLRQQLEARAAARVSRLKAAQSLAREKRAAFVAELDRQHTIVSEREAVAERERKDVERRQHAAEEAEFMASLRDSGGPPPVSAAEPAPAVASASKTSIWAAEPAPAVASASKTSIWAAAPAPASNAWTASAKGMSTPAPAPAASGTGLSPTTQRWLMSQGGAAQPAAAPMSAPVSAPAARNAPISAAPADASQDGLSPATRAWLAQQGAR